jgi:CheY-like chemotaxis protein/HPt (histidine-containing phosphotransfer) domain-containing protein
LAGWRILVVDDNAASRGLLMELLAFWKASGVEAGDAERAQDLLWGTNRRPFDVVLIDLEMPGGGGEKLGAAAREHPELADAALVLLTPLRLADDAERWRRSGFDGHVGKPVKQGELGACLASLLGYGPLAARPGGAARPSRNQKELRARLQLLVVEDNKVNQEVALGMLESLGYRADVVGDGRSALQALAGKDYDLVLMDCQLPEMDGYEASRRIRQPDSPVRRHDIPIVATTAHAMAGDREKCLDAGMSGYISKPLGLAALQQAIAQWTGGIRAVMDVGLPVPPPAVAPGAETAAFAPEDFIEQLMGNEALARRIVQGFVKDMPSQIALLARALNDLDAKKVRLVAHSIKGASASVCGLEMREVAERLEKAGSAEDLTVAAAVLPELSASFARLRPIMERFCIDS